MRKTTKLHKVWVCTLTDLLTYVATGILVGCTLSMLLIPALSGSR